MLKSEGISGIFWLWLPLAVIIAQAIAEVVLPHPVVERMMSENGPHELAQFFVLVIAFFVALSTLRHIDWKKDKWLGCWMLLALVCCFYVAGEEISWGQQFAHWNTPAYWATINDQDETNLHNTSSWLDQKPRMLLEIGVIIGGLVFPLLQRFKKGLLPEKFSIIYPAVIMCITSFITLAVHVLHHIDKHTTMKFFDRASEVEELYMFYFVLLYLVILKHRILQRKG